MQKFKSTKVEGVKNLLSCRYPIPPDEGVVVQVTARINQSRAQRGRAQRRRRRRATSPLIYLGLLSCILLPDGLRFDRPLPLRCSWGRGYRRGLSRPIYGSLGLEIFQYESRERGHVIRRGGHDMENMEFFDYEKNNKVGQVAKFASKLITCKSTCRITWDI